MSRVPILNGGRRWWTVGRTAQGGNPFATFGLTYCVRCKDETDTDTAAEYKDGVYVYRRWCLRCGQPTHYGAYAVPLLTDGPVPAAAMQWCFTPEQDRR